MNKLDEFCRQTTLDSLIALFSKVNQDSAEVKGCPVVQLSEWDFYAEQIHNLHEDELEYYQAEPLAQEMAARVKQTCNNCNIEAMGDCPRCFANTGLGCPHGELCGNCKTERDGEDEDS